MKNIETKNQIRINNIDIQHHYIQKLVINEKVIIK